MKATADPKSTTRFPIKPKTKQKANTMTQTQRERTVALNSLLSGGGRFKGVSISVVSITSYQFSSSSGIRQELCDGRNVVKSLALSPIATSCIPPRNANESLFASTFDYALETDMIRYSMARFFASNQILNVTSATVVTLTLQQV